uniref:glucan endo-1,3-beta-D-glucosidase n=1 Tax=Wollemia nobilis TaxID=56998 RepID=A0A0C9S8F1_9CONI
MAACGGHERRLMAVKVPFLYAVLVAAFGRLVAVFTDSGQTSHFNTNAVGINYGRVADNLPPPSVAVGLIQQLKAGSVKIYDADAQVLRALAGTGLQVVITVHNEDIANISSSPLLADQWIQQNVLPYYPSTLISTIMVGNEVLSTSSFGNDGQGAAEAQALLVPAMTNIQSALEDHNLGASIKVTTSLAMDVLSSSYPPSAGAFREDISAMVMQPMLELISRTNSYIFLDVYPYFAWISNSENVSLDYALLDAVGVTGIEDQGLTYTNMLDAQVDAVVAAMEKVGFPNVTVVISETGWPTGGQSGASVANAARYNQNLVRKALASPPAGTPRRPNTFIPVFVFALFNEDKKPGPVTERNWGLFYPDGSPVYSIVLSADDSPVSRYTQPAVPSEGNGSAPAGTQWCVVSPVAQVEEGSLQAALDYACAAGGDCSMIEPNQPCYLPDTLVSHASYAFNSYWQRSKAKGATCNFNGAATFTTSDPSFSGCIFEHT